MSVVFISAPHFSGGAEVAERTAQLLGYRNLAPEEVIEVAAHAYEMPSARLNQALDERARWRTMRAKERRIRLAAIQAALSDYLVEGDFVCHGLAAHLYVTGISHVLKTRLRSPIETRTAIAAQSEHLSTARARRLVLSLDKRRRRWVKALFDVDEDDTASFDLVIDTEEIAPEEAAVRIAETARRRRFQPMTYSLKKGRDFALASKVRAALVEIDPEVAVTADDGAIHVRATVIDKNSEKVIAFKERALAVPRVESVEVDVIDDVFAKAAVSMR